MFSFKNAISSFFPIFLILSLNQLLAASFFVLGPYVWEILGTEGVCSHYWYLYCLSVHYWHVYCLSGTGYWKLLTENLSYSFMNSLKIQTKFKNQESLLSLNLLGYEMHPGFWGRVSTFIALITHLGYYSLLPKPVIISFD